MARSLVVFDDVTSAQMVPFPALQRRALRLQRLAGVEDLLASSAARPLGIARERLLATRGSLMIEIASDEDDFRSHGPGRN